MKNAKVQRIAAGLAIVMTASVMSATTAFAAQKTQMPINSTHSAVCYQIGNKTSKKNTFAKAYILKVKAKATEAFNWTYTADNKNIKVKNSYDKAKGVYSFTFKGKGYGINNLTFKYKTGSKKWVSVPMTLFVDPQNSIMRTI